MKVRKIAKRVPPVRPVATRIRRFRSAKQVAKFFGPTLAETRKAWEFYSPAYDVRHIGI